MILNLVTPVYIRIDFPHKASEILDCYFYEVDPEKYLEELSGRISRFSQYTEKMALNYKVPVRKLSLTQMIFIPNRFKCTYHDWCGWEYNVLRYNIDNQVLTEPYILVAEKTGRSFKRYKNFAFLELDLGHLFNVFTGKHRIDIMKYDVAVRKGLLMEDR